MERNVMSWGVAIAKGHEARLYTYDSMQIPIGEFAAVLDFKIWSKRIIAINCYFTKTDSDERFVVTVNCNNQSGRFQLPGCDVNFADCAAGIHYRIEIAGNNKEGIVLLKAFAVL